MNCVLEIEIEQASFNLTEGNPCRYFDQNDFMGSVKTPAWILAKPQFTSNILVEVESEGILDYQK